MPVYAKAPLLHKCISTKIMDGLFSRVRVKACVYIHVLLCLHMCMRARMCKHVCVHVRACVRAYVCVCVHARMHACMRVYKCACIQVEHALQGNCTCMF